MPMFKVIGEWSVFQVFEVEANSIDEARDIILEKAEFPLDLANEAILNVDDYEIEQIA